MSFMWTIVLVSLLAVVVAAIGVAGLAGVVRMLRRPSHPSRRLAPAGTRWSLTRGNAPHVIGLNATLFSRRRGTGDQREEFRS